MHTRVDYILYVVTAVLGESDATKTDGTAKTGPPRVPASAVDPYRCQGRGDRSPERVGRLRRSPISILIKETNKQLLSSCVWCHVCHLLAILFIPDLLHFVTSRKYLRALNWTHEESSTCLESSKYKILIKTWRYCFFFQIEEISKCLIIKFNRINGTQWTL